MGNAKASVRGTGNKHGTTLSFYIPNPSRRCWREYPTIMNELLIYSNSAPNNAHLQIISVNKVLNKDSFNPLENWGPKLSRGFIHSLNMNQNQICDIIVPDDIAEDFDTVSQMLLLVLVDQECEMPCEIILNKKNKTNRWRRFRKTEKRLPSTHQCIYYYYVDEIQKSEKAESL